MGAAGDELRPTRLNLGCGHDLRDGYLNVDFQPHHRPDLLADVRDLGMLPSGHHEEIVAQDVLEHLTRVDGPAALREWARLLRPGGRLVLRVPNLLGLAHLFVVKTSVAEQQELAQCLFGTQAYDGDFHQSGYTELLLRQQLHDAGFGEVHITPFHEWLFDVTAIKVPPQGPGPRFEDCPFMTLGRPSEVLLGPSVPVAPEPSIRGSAADLRRAIERRLRRAVGRAR